MANFLWLEECKRTINLDKVLEIRFWDRVGYEQGGRFSWDPENEFDSSQPMVETKRELVADVTFDVTSSQELYSTIVMQLEERRYYGMAAYKILRAIDGPEREP